MEPKHIRRMEEIEINGCNGEALKQNGLSETCFDKTVMPIVHSRCNNTNKLSEEVSLRGKPAQLDDASHLCSKDSLNNDFHAPCMSCKEITTCNQYHRLPTCTREQGSQLKYVPNPAKFSSACLPSNTAQEFGIKNDPNCSKTHKSQVNDEQIPEFGILQRQSAAERKIDGVTSRVARYGERYSQDCTEITCTHSHSNAPSNPHIHTGVQNNNRNLEVREKFHRDSSACENTDGVSTTVQTSVNVNRPSICECSNVNAPTNRHNHSVQYNYDNLGVQQRIFREPNICWDTNINSKVRPCYNDSRASNNHECKRYSRFSPADTTDNTFCTYIERQLEKIQKSFKECDNLKMKYSNLKKLVIVLVFINLLVFALMLVHFIVNKCSCEVSDDKVTYIVSKQLTPIESMMNNHTQVFNDVKNTIKALGTDMPKDGIFRNLSQNMNGTIYAELHSKVSYQSNLINEFFTRQAPAIKLISTSLRDNKHPRWSAEIHSGEDKIEYKNDDRVHLKERGIYFVYCTLRFKGQCGNEKTLRFDMKDGSEDKIVGTARSECQDDTHFDTNLTIQSLINITKSGNFLYIHMGNFSLEQLHKHGPFFWWIFKL